MESTASFRRPARRGQRREGVDGKLRKQRFEVGFLHAICQLSSPKLNKHKAQGPSDTGGRERAAGAGRRMNLDAKREVAMAAKEEARRQRNASIAADKNAKSEARKQADSQARAEAEAQAEQTRKLMARREQNHARRAAARGHPDAIAGYCKADIVALKAAFDDFDRAVFGLDELTGLVDLESFVHCLRMQHEDLEREDVSILERFGEPAFADLHVVSWGGDATQDITFDWLLPRVCRAARPAQIESMMAWLGVEQEAAPKLSLDAEMQNSITAIFQMLRGGGLTLSKLREALASTGIDAEDLKSAFQEFDQDGNGALDANELASMMASSRV